MNYDYKHIEPRGIVIYAVFLKDGMIVQFKCPLCGYITINNAGFFPGAGPTIIFNNPFGHRKCKDTFTGEEMARAYLTYVLLNEQTQEGAYKIKLEGNFRNQIKPFVDFIKQIVPSSDRTYDPATYEWHYHEKYHDIIEKALQGALFKLEYIVSKDQYTELKRKQEEFARKQQQPISTEIIDVDKDLEIFEHLLLGAGLKWNKPPDEWNREIASKAYKKAIMFYHPDLHPEREEQSYQLNTVWKRLQEAYYANRS